MRYGHPHEVVVLHDRLEALTFQLAELVHLRAQVLLAEQNARESRKVRTRGGSWERELPAKEGLCRNARTVAAVCDLFCGR